MKQQVRHKRGDSFEVAATYSDEAGAPINLTGYTVTSQVRSINARLVETLTARITDVVGGKYKLTSAGTSAWPVDTLQWDIKYTVGGTIVHTETISIVVEQVQTE